MKELNKYIVEKLKINKDTQNNSIIKSLDELYSDYGKYLKEKKIAICRIICNCSKR